MNDRSSKSLFLAIVILALVSIGIMLLVRYPFADMGSTDPANGGRAEQRQARPLADAASAEFLTVFVYGEGNEMSAYMVGGKTGEFGAFGEAVTGSVPSAGEKDETYSDLLVFSFADGSTMEIAYSPSVNTISYEGILYTLPIELQPKISAVEERFKE